MSLHITSEMLRAGYEFLRATPPFAKWRLPPPDYVMFVVCKTKDKRGDYEMLANGVHCIRISEHNSGHTINVLATLAHEMVHLHQTDAKTPGRRAEHGAEFKRFAAQVCRHHGFDLKAF